MASNDIPVFQSPIGAANDDVLSNTPTIGVRSREQTSVALVPRPGGSGIQPVLFTFRRQAADEYRITVGGMTTGATENGLVIASSQESQIWTIKHYTHPQRGDVYTIGRFVGLLYEVWTTNTTDGTIYLSPLRDIPTNNQYFRFEV